MFKILKVHHETHIVDNKAKGPISKRVLQENKTRQIFRKTRMCAYQGIKNVRFSKNLIEEKTKSILTSQDVKCEI